MKYQVDNLDLVIIRSCQLSCQGCCTFSDHREVKGLQNISDMAPAIRYWSRYITPKRLILFGGEPTMHPKLVEWFRLAAECWPKTWDGYDMPIWVNTNGYYIDKLFDHVDELFVDGPSRMFLSVTHHTTTEPYYSLVLDNFTRLKELILEACSRKFPDFGLHWVTGTEWDGPDKEFHLLRDKSNTRNIMMLSFTRQYETHFVSHYRGHSKDLKPWHDYSDTQAMIENHRECHIKNYVQIYDGKLWKCPPRAVLNQTLETYNLQDNQDWLPYYRDYAYLDINSSESDIESWFTRQKGPENTCNMCGFMYSRGDFLPAQQHLPKKMFSLKSV